MNDRDKLLVNMVTAFAAGKKVEARPKACVAWFVCNTMEGVTLAWQQKMDMRLKCEPRKIVVVYTETGTVHSTYSPVEWETVHNAVPRNFTSVPFTEDLT
jgi:hypothetical protein